MASPRFNSKSPTIKRILREAAELSHSPSPDYHASPATDSDLFTWHFTLRGPPSSSFAAGIYHGRIVLPPTYPLRPPSFRFLTPSGRFEANREICLSISGHHEEMWQPAWGIRTALVALRSFMETDAKGQLGGLECSERERVEMAGRSGGWRCSVCAKTNLEIITESAEAANEKDGEAVEVEVPKELKMGFKDQMGKGKEVDTAEDAQLAEGFIRTVDGAAETEEVPNPASIITRNLERIQESVRNSQPAPAPVQRVQPVPVTTAQQLAQRRSGDGVPMWIDRAIAGVVVLLIAMVVKMVLGV